MRFFFALLILSAGISALYSNGVAPPAAATSFLSYDQNVQDSSRVLYVLRAARNNFQRIDSVTSLVSLAGNVAVRQETTLFYADSVVINQRTNVMQAYGNVHINDNDTLHTYTNYLRYLGDGQIAYLRGNVRLTDNKGSTLTTQELTYNMNTGIAEYLKSGRIVNKETILDSRIARYYEATKDVIFSGNVRMNDPQYKMTTDSLQYNSQTEIATIIAPTHILDVKNKRTIYTSSGYYDLKNGSAYFASRPSIVDSSFSITSDEMAFNDRDGFGQFNGNVVFNDTINKLSILSNQLFVNNKTSSFLATQKPLLILEQDNDSLFVTADTLLSGRITSLTREIPPINDTGVVQVTDFDFEGKDSSMNRYFEAWHNVRIFSDSVQAVSDSMFFSATDSVFRMFHNPYAWSSDSQISADTMYLFTKNRKAERLLAYFNGFIANRLEESAFNQIKGNTLNAWFVDGNISYVRAKGRAETIYFALDDEDRFVSMNRSTSDAVDMFFEDRKPTKVVFIVGLEGVAYPMTQIPPAERYIGGFNWRDDLRPKSKFEMIGR